ncbi:cyclin-dependent kinase complex component [Trichoderma arundinaceum]|uniref:Cyclin-dependent kinase complex component n=1 Tax=Trichoderma arundinaceum TaxID=490622 RepID=A0A395N6X9_TRIAR|nr:cyclin-dependent kinase complex component [Trichoderma arundinaceum]
MAAVIGDFVPDLSRFHSMISSSPSSSIPQRQDSQTHDSAAPYRSTSRHRLSGSVPRSQTSASDIAASSRSAAAAAARPAQQQGQAQAGQSASRAASSGGASRFPSPPPSSSPAAAPGPVAADDENSASMATQIGDNVSAAALHQQPSSSDLAAPQNQQPSPTSDDYPIRSGPVAGSDSYLVSSTSASSIPEQNVIHIRDLAHIEKLAEADLAGDADRSGILNDPPLHQTKYEISAMPIADVIEMVAALLTKITTTNDLQHDAMQRNVAHQQQANQTADAHGGSQMSPLSHSVLAFHGKNVPAITILSYLSRIDKYCPTTYEVFLSLLVYFDRMTERVNDMVSRTERSRRCSTSRTRGSASVASHDTPMGEASRSPDESDEDLADDDDESDDDEVMVDPPSRHACETGRSAATPAAERSLGLPTPATYFVVDSFNIHRLIIAGVTCSSKFFSDVFYTNSRYAKVRKRGNLKASGIVFFHSDANARRQVGGLPLPELNHLELQFLVLNDFRLAIPVEELEAYATMLVEFYAREVVAPRSRRM